MLAPAAPRFLVVDDQIVHRLCARVILQHAWPGCVVEEANSLRWARAFLAERHYDLMLLDFHLPDGIGIELLGVFLGHCVDVQFVHHGFHFCFHPAMSVQGPVHPTGHQGLVVHPCQGDLQLALTLQVRILCHQPITA